MTAKVDELRSRAKVIGIVRIPTRVIYSWSPSAQEIDELEHYFDENWLEVGYVSKLMKPHTVHVFDPPRVWAPQYLTPERLRILERLPGGELMQQP